MREQIPMWPFWRILPGFVVMAARRTKAELWAYGCDRLPRHLDDGPIAFRFRAAMDWR